MKEILTNEEIDTLLELFRSEGAPPEAELLSPAGMGEGKPPAWSGGPPGAPADPSPPRAKRVQRFDLLRPNRFTREQIHYLEKLQEVASLGMTATLMERLRLEGTCDCVLVEQQRFGAFLAALRPPVAVYLVEIRPPGQRGLLALSCPILFAAIDRIMGGKGKVEDPGRDLTEVEYAVVEPLVAHLLADLAGGLGELVALELRPAGRPRNLALAQVVGSQEVVLCLHFQVSGDPLAGDIRLILPHAVLAPHLARIDQAGGGEHGEERAFRPLLEERLKTTPFGVAVELGRARLKLRDLMELKAGDLVVLEARPGDPVLVPVGGIPKYQGVLGVRGRRLAVRVSGPAPAAGGEGG